MQTGLVAFSLIVNVVAVAIIIAIIIAIIVIAYVNSVHSPNDVGRSKHPVVVSNPTPPDVSSWIDRHSRLGEACASAIAELQKDNALGAFAHLSAALEADRAIAHVRRVQTQRIGPEDTA